MSQGDRAEEEDDGDDKNGGDNYDLLTMSVQPSRGGEQRPFHGNGNKCIADHCA